MSLEEAQKRKCLFFEIWLKSKIDGTRQPASRRTAIRQACGCSPGPIAGLNYSIIMNSMNLVRISMGVIRRPDCWHDLQPSQKSFETTTQTTKGQSEFRAFSLKMQTGIQ